MKARVIGIAGLAAALASIGLANVHPWGNLRAAEATDPPILNSATIPADVRSRLATSCGDCHSANTRWPVYSHFAPASWLLEHDVHEARGAMDLSHWSALAPDDQLRLLASIAAEVRTRRMPPPRYLVLHPAARLSDDDRRSLIAWSHAERDRLRQQTSTLKEKP